MDTNFQPSVEVQNLVQMLSVKQSLNSHPFGWAFAFSGEFAKQFARDGVIALLYIEDDRGLEAILTDQEYIKNLQTVEKWDADSNVETFRLLKEKHEALIGQQPSARERAAIYELCELRKDSGAARIESTASVIDLSAL